MKRLLGLIVIALVLFTSSGCQNPASTPTHSYMNKPQVYATFYPMFYLTEKIGGDKIQVTTLIPPGVEPHDWEPTPKTLATLSQTSLLVANGLNMEPWLKDLAQVAPDTKVLQVAEGLNRGDTSDPHLWLDPILMQKMARQVADALIKLQPENQKYYEQNLQNLNHELTELDREFSTTLAQVKNRDLVVSHEAFGYLAKRYNLNQVALRGLDPDAEPTPAKMAELVDYCKQRKIKYVFYEELINPKVSEILAKEVGAQTVALNPLESLTPEEAQHNKDYIDIMRENLAHLEQGLK